MGLATIAAYRVVLFPDSKLAQAWEEKIALVWLTGTYCVKLGRCEGSTGIFFFFSEAILCLKVHYKSLRIVTEV